MSKRPTKSKHPAKARGPAKSGKTGKPEPAELPPALPPGFFTKKPLPRVKETARAPYTPRPNEIVMSATHFKAHCLEVMDQVKTTQKEVVITKRNTPVAKLVPVPAERPLLHGFMKGTVQILGDIVSPDYESWEER